MIRYHSQHLLSALPLALLIVAQAAHATPSSFICVGSDTIAEKYKVEARASVTKEWRSLDYTIYEKEKAHEEFGFPPAYTVLDERPNQVMVRGYRKMNPGLFSNSIAKIVIQTTPFTKKKFSSRILREAGMEPKTPVDIYSGLLEIYDDSSFEGKTKLECITLKNES